MDVNKKIKIRDELRKIGFRKNLYVLRCANKWIGSDGFWKRCTFETEPAADIYLTSKYNKGLVSCSVCFQNPRPERANLRNFKKEPYTPLIISLRCSGAKIGKNPNGLIRREPCGEYIGTDWLWNFRNMLRTGKLRCSCGSKSFVRTDRNLSQAELLVKMLNQGRLPNFAKLLDNIPARDIAGILKEEGFRIENV